MVTLKQLEALRWIVALGSYEKAADQLHTTQSAISKRILELETTLGFAMFNRGTRGSRLTVKGQSVLATGEEMLALRDRIVAASTSAGLNVRRLRFGVTELTALTWLPDLVAGIRETFPNIVLEPEVEQSAELFGRLREGTVDFIIIPDAFWHPDIKVFPLAHVQNSWMCSPVLFHERQIVPLQSLSSYHILTQGDRSGSGIIFQKWLQRSNVQLPHLVSSNSLVALVGMTLAAIGISYLPQPCFEGLVGRGRLRIVETDPALPPVTYVAMVRSDYPEPLADLLLNIARTACDFSHPITWN